jgi:hypothetical protein
MIQALEKMDDPIAIPILEQVAENDHFQTVRQYAAAAVSRLTGGRSFIDPHRFRPLFNPWPIER